MIANIYKHIDLAYLELMADGDEDMKKTMLEMLLEELPAEVDKMSNLLQAQDWKTLKAVSHKLKSTLAFVGNEILTAANKRVERIVTEESDMGKLPDSLETIHLQTKLAMTELQLEFSKL